MRVRLEISMFGDHPFEPLLGCGEPEFDVEHTDDEEIGRRFRAALGNHTIHAGDVFRVAVVEQSPTAHLGASEARQ